MLEHLRELELMVPARLRVGKQKKTMLKLRHLTMKMRPLGTHASFVLLVMLVLLPMGAPGRVAAAERVVPSTELRKIFPGKFQAHVKGYRVRFVAASNGLLKGYYGSFTDTGRWSVRGNRLCIMLKDWLDGKTTCSPVRRTRGSWYVARGIRFRRM